VKATCGICVKFSLIRWKWSSGMMESWNDGMMEQWNFGMMEFWNDGMME
jgi:hypothetical protein